MSDLNFQSLPNADREISLDPDKRAVAAREIRDIHLGLAALTDFLQKDAVVTVEFVHNVISVVEYRLGELARELGVETDGTVQREERYAKLREANGRIRELEGLLGNAEAPELTQMALKKLHERLNGWWDLEGFGHVSEVAFGPYGAEVNFSCSLFGDFRLTDSRSPVSDKERKALWHKSLEDRGFELLWDGREPSLKDCDRTRRVLAELFSGRLPSAKISSYVNHASRVGAFELRSVTVFIRRLEEILALPVAESREG